MINYRVCSLSATNRPYRIDLDAAGMGRDGDRRLSHDPTQTAHLLTV